jgi:hypothetical protein
VHRILLTGCGSPASQNVLASLRDADEHCHIVGADLNVYHLEWGDLDAAYQAPPTDSDEYLPFLRAVIEREGIEFVHGQPDWEVVALSAHRRELGAATFLPSHRAILRCQDKAVCARLWHDAGLRDDAPQLVAPGDDLEAVADRLGLPFWIRATQGAGARGSCKVDEPRQGETWLDYWGLRRTGWQFIAQEYLPGREFAFQSLWHDGALVTSAVRERLEFVFPQHAPSGTTSSPVVARSVHEAPVNEAATRAILAVDDHPHGIYCVDLKCDGAGIPRPTEINAGRFFTTSYFFTKLGCNMPLYYVKLALGEPLPELPKYDAVPADRYWIRHIDCGSVVRIEGQWRAIPLEEIRSAHRVLAASAQFAADPEGALSASSE